MKNFYAKSIVLLVFMLVLSLSLLSCGGGGAETGLMADTQNTTSGGDVTTDPPVTDSGFGETTPTDIKLIEDGKTDYKIVLPATASDAVRAAAEELSAALCQSTAVYVPTTDSDTDCAIYLNVGNGVGLYDGDNVGECGYAIRAIGDDLYIYGATEASFMYALATFDNEFIDTAEGGALTIPAGTAIKVQLDEKLILADLLDMGLGVSAWIEEFISYGKITVDGKSYRIAQGAATDGEYIYFVIKYSEWSGVIVKIDFTGKQIAVSQPHDFGHANDITFDTERNLVVVVHGSSTQNTANGNGNGRRLSFLDGDTLELVHTDPEILADGKGAGAISYNTETGIYTIGRGGTKYHQFTLDENFKVKYSLSANRESEANEGRVGYVGQGMGGDNRYVYFPYSNDSSAAAFDNMLVVYDNSAKYVGNIHIDTQMESESMFYHDGHYYICFNHNGAQLYELMYEPVYRASALEYDAIDETVSVISSSGFLYGADTRMSRRIESLTPGTEYRAVGFSKDRSWYRVRLDDGSYAYVLAISVMAAEYDSVTQTSVNMTVTADALNVRRRPDADTQGGSHIVGVLTKGKSVTVTGTIEGSKWVRISYNGKSCFVSSDYLK